MDSLLGPSPRARDLARTSFDEGEGDASNGMQQSSVLDVTDATIGQLTTGSAHSANSTRLGMLGGLVQPCFQTGRGERCFWKAMRCSVPVFG